MKKVDKIFAAAAAVFAVAYATPSFACFYGSYVSVPPANYTGTVTAAQNVSLYPDSSIYSPNGVYRLIFQQDGNLVLYKNGSQVIWAADVQNCSPTPNTVVRARFQTDGNLVIYYAVTNNVT